VSKTIYTSTRKESTRELFNKALDNINIAKEIADGLRVIFDFNLRSVLLYGSHGEAGQYADVMKPGNVLKRPVSNTEPEPYCFENNEVAGSSRSSTTSGRSSSAGPTPTTASTPSPSTPQARQVSTTIKSFN
jgi:hypothetical protein